MPGDVASYNADELALQRERLKSFMNGHERYLIVPLKCRADELVSYVYSVCFAGKKKYRFYLNFFVARIAQYIDYSPLKVFLYRTIGMKIGKGVFISPDVILDPHFPELIEIGDYSTLGWGAKLFAHEATKTSYRIGRITVGKGVMLGAWTVVRGGVSIGEDAETSFHSFVLKDLPAGGKIGHKEVLNQIEESMK